MPEGPEIRRAADRLERALVDVDLIEVWFKFPALQDFRERLQGSRITEVETRGKAMLLHFACRLCIYSHNQLYGLWQVHAVHEPWLSSRDLRIQLRTNAASVCLYSASDISVWKRDALPDHPFLKKLGPDALHASLTLEKLCERLQVPSFQRSSLAALLLEQRFLAGLGNYLRSEILFAARIHPSLRLAELDLQTKRVLADTILAITRRSYENGGVTNELALSGQIDTQALPFEGYRFAIFERDGQACYRCNDTVQRSDAFGRRVYFCPKCQSK